MNDLAIDRAYDAALRVDEHRRARETELEERLVAVRSDLNRIAAELRGERLTLSGLRLRCNELKRELRSVHDSLAERGEEPDGDGLGMRPCECDRLARVLSAALDDMGGQS